MEKITNMTVDEFSMQLAAKVPVPGGGGAAALVGALGAALCSMSANYTYGKKKYAAYDEELKAILDECDKLRKGLLDLIQKDADGFEPLSKAYAIPADAPGRGEALEKATIDALEAPMEMLRAIKRSVELLERMEEIGSPLMISDVGCGAALASSALKSSSLNVFINTGSLKDRALAEKLEAEADAILADYVARADKIAERVTKKIRS